MKNRHLLLALAALALAPSAASASEGFLSRTFTLPDGRGRWIDRRLTIRRHDQDAPWLAGRARREDGFLGRAFTEPHDRGRWIDRRLTLRHHEG